MQGVCLCVYVCTCTSIYNLWIVHEMSYYWPFTSKSSSASGTFIMVLILCTWFAVFCAYLNFLNWVLTNVTRKGIFNGMRLTILWKGHSTEPSKSCTPRQVPASCRLEAEPLIQISLDQEDICPSCDYI